MMRVRFTVAIALIGLLLAAGLASADVKSTEKTQMKFEGMLGRMAGLFGGKAMKDGLVNTVAVKGDRKITSSEDSAEIVDLAEEKVYQLNLRDKSYKVVTFAELRKQMEDARAKAEEEARKQQAREKKDPNEKEMELDFNVKNTGQKREINGFSCHQVIVTIGIHEKGKTLEQAGGMLMTTDMWLAPKVAALKERMDFDVRYYKKLSEGAALPSAEQMAQAFAMYPGLKDAMAKMQAEKGSMDGTPIESVMTVQTVQTKEQAEARKKDEGGQSATPGGAIGGMLGRFGKKKEEPKPAEGGAAKPTADSDTKVTFMTVTNTVLSVTPTVSAEDLAIPAGFKLKK